MVVVRASSKGQIAIPKRFRTRLGIKPGAPLSLTETDEGVLITPLPDDPIQFLSGIFRDGPSLTQELLKERASDLEHE